MKSSTGEQSVSRILRSMSVVLIAAAVLGVASWQLPLSAQERAGDACARPQAGSVITEPPDVRSKNGVLEISLTAEDAVQPDGTTRYCFTDAEGRESPNLRANPGDLVIIHLKNAMTQPEHAGPEPQHAHSPAPGNKCTGGSMTLISTNLHFHGLTIPPTCHQDDVLKTSLQPGDPPFEYRFRIPDDEPPGLYWYHPHIHGFSKQQLLGGASGALIVEGIERAKKEVAGLPERVFIIRDQDLVNPNAPPSKSEPVVPKFMIDRDGDAANNGTGFGKPAKDLSINYVPVPYPDYPPATIEMKPGERQLWRVLNASAITYLNLEVLFGHSPQPLGLVGMDGVPIGYGLDEARAGEPVEPQTHLGIPPGARVEFIVQGPPEGENGAAGYADCRHRSGRRERHESDAGQDRRLAGCSRASLETAEFPAAVTSAGTPVAGRCGSGAGPAPVFLREAA